MRRSSSTADAPAEFEGTPQRDLAGVGEGDGSAQRLLELTDVEGPSVAKQGAGSEAIQGNAFGLGRHARQDRSDQRVEIFEAIAQCRQHHLEAGETRLEILTEPAIDAARGDGLVGRGNDPDVGLDGVVAPTGRTSRRFHGRRDPVRPAHDLSDLQLWIQASNTAIHGRILSNVGFVPMRRAFSQIVFSMTNVPCPPSPPCLALDPASMIKVSLFSGGTTTNELWSDDVRWTAN